MSKLFLVNRLFFLLSFVFLLFVLSFTWEWIFIFAQIALALVFILLAIDIYFLLKSDLKITAQRILAPKLSLGDSNKVRLKLQNSYKKALKLELIDELPSQLQRRDFSIDVLLEAEQSKTISYFINPVSRGVYNFGKLNLFLLGTLGLVQRRFQFDIGQDVAVYPSILQMKKYELIAHSQIAQTYGVKRLRRLGHSYEFEQIKNYVRGDDIRSINWKATSRQAKLMVNQYTDERSQQVYLLIDKSRAMKMPFENLSLLDYAINSSLVMANIILQKEDKVGLLTFSDKIGIRLAASRKKGQLNRIIESLYKQKTEFQEANYELLYQEVKRSVKGRSLLLLFSNFESIAALKRAMPMLRHLHKQHLLIIIFFENTELTTFAKQDAEDLEQIYLQTVAQKFVSEKQLMVEELRKTGIQSILTAPKNLSINTLNKYLELKSRGMI